MTPSIVGRAPLTWLLISMALADAGSRSAGDLFTLRLERSSFRDAEKILGKTEARDNGLDAGAHAVSSCYRGRDGTVVVLTSNGEMGGGTRLTDIQLLSDKRLARFTPDLRFRVSKDHEPPCSFSKLISRDTQLGGIGLGIGRADAARTLGRGHSESPTELWLRSERVVSPERELRQVRSISVEIENEKVVAVRLVQTTSD